MPGPVVPKSSCVKVYLTFRASSSKMFLSGDGRIQCRGMGGLYLDPIRPPRFEAWQKLSQNELTFT